MPEPSPEELHTALSRSYLSPAAAGGAGQQGAGAREQPVRLADLLRVLGADLRTPGDKRKRKPIPRVVLGVALWNLAVRHLNPKDVPDADRAAVKDLDALVKDVFGWHLAQLEAMRQQNMNPLLMIARQYSILDYRWEPPQSGAKTVVAKLEVLVQRPLEQLKEAIEPATWPSKCALFWADVVPSDGHVLASRGQNRAVDFKAKLKLPGQGSDNNPAVQVNCKVSKTHLGFTNAFEIIADRPLQQRPSVICRGSISAEKEEGQPWATRIKHEKRMSLGSGVLDGHEVDTLNYWIQAETVCLVSPH